MQNITLSNIFLVLCASSTYFDRMLTTDFKEKESGTIELSGGLEPASVRRVIDFFYSGILHADPTNICSVLAVVDLFLLDQTKASLIR